jgi:hypothetical protein
VRKQRLPSWNPARFNLTVALRHRPSARPGSVPVALVLLLAGVQGDMEESRHSA